MSVTTAVVNVTCNTCDIKKAHKKIIMATGSGYYCINFKSTLCSLLLISLHLFTILPSTRCEELTAFNQTQIQYLSNIPFISLNHLVFKIIADDYEQGNNSFFIGARNHVFRIDSNLQIRDWVKNGPKMDNRRCRPLDIENCKSQSEQDQDNHVILLHKDTNPSPKIISCGTLLQGMCMIHNYGALKRAGILGDPNDSTNYVSSFKYTLAFPVDKSKDQYKNETAYIIGHEYDDRPVQYSPPSLSSRRIATYPKPLFHYSHSERSNSSIDVKPESKGTYPIKYVHGFHDDNYIYVISNQKVSPHASDFETRIGRICINDTTLRSYTELVVICEIDQEAPGKIDVGFNSSNVYNIATTAHYGHLGSELQSTLGVSSSNDFLFIAFAQSKSQQMLTLNRSAGSLVCGVSLEKLEKQFNYVVEQCFQGENMQASLHPVFNNAVEGANTCTAHYTSQNVFCGQSHYNPYIFGKDPLLIEPLIHVKDNKITSLITHVEKESTIALIGTENGHLIKALLNPKPELLFRQDFSAKGTPKLDEVKPDPVTGKGFALFSVADRIIKFPTNSCSIYSSCATCIQSRDPLGCGWCGNSCASSSECSKELSRSCSPVIYSFTPQSGPIEGGTEITIIGDNFGHTQSGSPVDIKITGTRYPVDCSVINRNNEQITCATRQSSQVYSGMISVTTKDTSRKLGNYIIDGTGESEKMFSFKKPNVEFIEPLFGPISGGAKITVNGTDLDVGSKRKVSVIVTDEKSSSTVPCNITSFTKSSLTCEMQSYKGKSKNGSFKVEIDDKKIGTKFIYTFKNDPVIKEILPKDIAISSQSEITIIGSNLDSISKPVLTIADLNIICNTSSAELITCSLPKFNQSFVTERNIPIAITNDGIRVSKQPNNLYLTVHPDPLFYPIAKSDFVYLDDLRLELRGTNLTHAFEIAKYKQINITISHDKFPCVPISSEFGRFTCEIKFGDTLPSNTDELNVSYSIGSVERSLGEVRFVDRPKAGINPIYWIGLVSILALFTYGILYYRKKSKANEKEYGQVTFTASPQMNGKFKFF